MERRLAAILAADVVGYSRLMEADFASATRLLIQETVSCKDGHQSNGRTILALNSHTAGVSG